MPLSEEDVCFFYPRFYCVGCGEKIPIPITPEEAHALARKPERNRRLNGEHGSKK